MVETLTPEDVPKGLSIPDVEGDLSEEQKAAIDLGQAKVRFEERGEARIHTEQEALRQLSGDSAERKGDPMTEGATPEGQKATKPTGTQPLPPAKKTAPAPVKK